VSRPKRTVFDNEHQVKVETQSTIDVKVFGKELVDKKESVAYRSNFCHSSL